jgi:DeoR/GlpR family transcriptional regulator of sugar metabolism
METLEALSAFPCASAFAESLRDISAERIGLAKELAALATSVETVVLDAGSTSFLVAEEIAARTCGNLRTVITNNLAVSLTLGSDARACVQLAGVVDDLHLCVIPDAAAIRDAIRRFSAGDSLFILTAAALSVSPKGVTVRARRPDQFPFKRGALSATTRVVVAAELPKFYLPFDGEHAFDLTSSQGEVWLAASESARATGNTTVARLQSAGFAVTRIDVPAVTGNAAPGVGDRTS